MPREASRRRGRSSESGRRPRATLAPAPDTRQRADGRLDLVGVWALGQYVDQLVRAELALHGVSGELLAVLAAVGDGPVTTSELATALGEPYMTVSDQIDRLVAAGEVRREPHPEDGRAKLVVLTGAGRDRLRQTGPFVRVVERTIRERLTLEVGAVVEALVDLRRAIELAVAELEVAS